MQVQHSSRVGGRAAHRNGNYRWILDSNRVLRDAIGTPCGLVGGWTDITERKQAEIVSGRLAAIVESSDDAIIGKDLNGILTSWNKGAEKTFGYSASEMVGTSVLRLIPADRHDEESQILGKINCGESEHFETLRKTRDGRLIDVAVTVSPIKDAAGKVVGASKVARDITARRRGESELEQMHNQLLAVSRQAGMAEFATGVLHNVGNVLNSVNVASTCVSDSIKRSKSGRLTQVVELMCQHEADLGGYLTGNPQGKEILGYLKRLASYLVSEETSLLEELSGLQKNVEHIKNIITVQQDSTKVSHSPEMIRLADLVEDAFRMNANGLRNNGIQVVREFEEIQPIMTRKDVVLQILVNLMRNAMQACEGTSTAEKRLTIRLSQAAGRARIEVADNGSGILPENLPRIFAHGFTTKKDGHGFGLHNAAMAANEMGGSLTVQSDGPGRGATFTLELPIETTRLASKPG
jgi:two-component system, LuxR family, sensor kinase FixL